MAAGTVTLVDPRTATPYTLQVVDRTWRTNMTANGARFTVTWRASWNNRFIIRALLLGRTRFVSLGAQQAGYLSRELPHASPEVTWLRCMHCDIEGKIPRPASEALVDDYPHYRYAYFHCIYELPKPRHFFYPDTSALVIDPTGDMGGNPDEALLSRYVSRHYKSKNRVVHGAGGMWKFEHSGRPFFEKNFVSLTDTQIVYTWHQIPKINVPRTRILGCLNTTNSVAFDVFGPETLIFEDFEEEDTDLTTGEAGVNLHFTISIPAYGPYAVPDPNDGGRFRNLIATDGSGRRPYGKTNFKWAFRPVDDPTLAFP